MSNEASDDQISHVKVIAEARACWLQRFVERSRYAAVERDGLTASHGV
jgi:hypothetical protein